MNLDEIKNKLLKEKEELKILLESQKEEFSEIAVETESAADIIADVYEYKQETHLTKEALELRIKEIDKALDKIEKGTYGICEECGGIIEEVRLKIDPATYLCRQCALKQNK
jgi:DnaK suppressor protein